LRGQAGAVGQKLASDPPPGKLIALDIRDLVVPALFVDALPQAQQVDMAAADLGLALQDSAAPTSTHAQNRRAHQTHPRFSWYCSNVSRNSSRSWAWSAAGSSALFGAILRLSHLRGVREKGVARHAPCLRCARRNGGCGCLRTCAARLVAMMDEHQNAALLTSPRVPGAWRRVT
jgi:hypothetical protein